METAETTRPRRSLFRRGLLFLLNSTATVAVVAGAAYLALEGQGLIADRAEAAAGAIEAEAPATPVSVTRISTEPGFAVNRTFTGQIEAAQTTGLSFEFAGRLTEVLVDEGDIVQEGQPLARLDTSRLLSEQDRLAASRAALEAQLAFARSSVERREALVERGFSSQETLDQAISTRDALIAQIAETNAAIADVEIRLSKSEIRAPFEGRIGARQADTGTTVGGGQDVLEIVEAARPLVRVGLPSGFDATELDRVEISVDGVPYTARLRSFRPDIDPVTRTRTAIFALETDRALAFGQTATLSLPTQIDVEGAWIPLAALREGTQGLWTVLMIDAEDRVRPAAIEVLHVDGTRAYVRGTFGDTGLMVSLGAHRVSPGQHVQPIENGA